MIKFKDWLNIKEEDGGASGGDATSGGNATSGGDANGAASVGDTASGGEAGGNIPTIGDDSGTMSRDISKYSHRCCGFGFYPWYYKKEEKKKRKKRKKRKNKK